MEAAAIAAKLIAAICSSPGHRCSSRAALLQGFLLPYFHANYWMGLRAIGWPCTTNRRRDSLCMLMPDCLLPASAARRRATCSRITTRTTGLAWSPTPAITPSLAGQTQSTLGPSRQTTATGAACARPPGTTCPSPTISPRPSTAAWPPPPRRAAARGAGRTPTAPTPWCRCAASKVGAGCGLRCCPAAATRRPGQGTAWGPARPRAAGAE